jgi:hypothetical protein
MTCERHWQLCVCVTLFGRSVYRNGSEIEYEAAGIQAGSDEAYMCELRIKEMIYDFLLITGSDAGTKYHRGNRGTGHL